MKDKILSISLFLGLAFALKNVSASPVEAGFGKTKVAGLMQFWYQNDNGATTKDNFRLRRAEIKLSGEITPQVSWAVMIDPAQLREDDTIGTVTVSGTQSVITSVGRKSPLQDFVITLKPHKYCSIDFGQYKVPFGMEGLESSAKLDLIERAALASQFKWADARDIGITLKGDIKLGDVKIQPAIGVYNGEGQNRLDVNEPMDVAGRLVIKPIEQLHIGVAYYDGKSGTATVENYRWGGEVKFVQDPISIYGEYARGKSKGKEKRTYYGTLGFKFLNRFQAVARYDYYDPDINTEKDSRTETTLGLNYFIEEHHSKLQLNYVFCGEKESISNDVLRVNLQISY